MKTYYYVMLAWRFPQTLSWEYEGAVIDVHPLEYVLESRADRSAHALWWIEISKEDYERFNGDF